MKVGVPKEIKNNENRVGLVPSSVRELTHHGHEVLVETKAGIGAGLTDAEYAEAGARIVATARCSSPICISRPIRTRRMI